MLFLVGVFEENTDFYSGSFFFRQFNAIGPLFCSFVQHRQLELWTSKRYSKPQNLVENKNIDVQNLENIGPLWCFSLGFFSALCDFFLKLFGFHQRVSPSIFSIFCITMDLKKSQRVPSFTIFGTVTLFKNFKIFSIFFNVSKGSPFNFLKFCNQLEFHKAQRVPPFTILSLRYSADFGRSRLVCF